MEKKKIKSYITKFPYFEAAIFALGLTLDLLTKYFAAKNNVHNLFTLFGREFGFDYTENRGAAFSFLRNWAGARTFFIVLSCLVIPAIGGFLYYSRKNGVLCRLSLAFIITGATGNLADRLFLGYVRDFIAQFFGTIFNVADAFLSVGVVLFIVYFIFFYKEPKKKGIENGSGQKHC